MRENTWTFTAASIVRLPCCWYIKFYLLSFQFCSDVVEIGLPKSYNRKVCVTSVEFIKHGFVVLLSTFSPSKTNGYAVSATQTKHARPGQPLYYIIL